MKTRNLKVSIIKLDLSKAYNRVNLIYIGILMSHLGFEIDFIRSIMIYISMDSFVILINGEASFFFHAKRGLRQGFPLPPYSLYLSWKG